MNDEVGMKPWLPSTSLAYHKIATPLLQPVSFSLHVYVQVLLNASTVLSQTCTLYLPWARDHSTA